MAQAAIWMVFATFKVLARFVSARRGAVRVLWGVVVCSAFRGVEWGCNGFLGVLWDVLVA